VQKTLTGPDSTLPGPQLNLAAAHSQLKAIFSLSVHCLGLAVPISVVILGQEMPVSNNAHSASRAYAARAIS